MKPSCRGPYLFVGFRLSSLRTANYGIVFLVGTLLLLYQFGLATSALAQVTVTPSALSFGNHFVGTKTAAKTVTLTNARAVPLTISSIAVSGGTGPGDYALGIMCPLYRPLGAGLSCSINVRFQPSAPGSRTATLTFTDNASNSPQSVAVTGVGVAPVTVSPTTLTFGNHPVGMKSASTVITLTNAQTVPLTISSSAISGGNAAGDYLWAVICPMSPRTLGAGLSCTINVAIKPSALGSRTATLTITDSASNSPQSVALTGVGVAPVTVSPTSVTFASQSIGTKSASKTITLTNHLVSALFLSSVSASGDFAVASNTCGSSIDAGAQCRIGVTFTPTVTGLRTGTLSIYHSAFGSPILVPLNGAGNNNQTWGKIQHVVIIFQENRTPDNLFQDPVLIANGADIAGSGLNSTGQTIPLTPIDLGSTGSNPQVYDPHHDHASFVAMYNGGKMDGADKILISCFGYPNCPPASPQFRYVLPSDVVPYFQMAEQYTFADRMFQTNQGPSFPAHQFILSGTSAPTKTSNSFAAENPGGATAGSDAGCIAPPSEHVWLIDPTGNESSTMYPCFEHPTLTDLLEAAHITWRYYTPLAGSIWTAPNSIQHMCGPNAPLPNATACTGADWTNHVVVANDQNPAAVLQDIASGQLASMSWVIPTGLASDHANTNDGSGPSWVASIVNAIGASSYWSNTAVIITWDDWGGWYDHVLPPQVINDGTSWGSGYVYGFRVPLIVVSPYAKAGYISHVTHDFGSILKMVEQVFNLPSLGYADARADDLSDCFNFTQSPLPFQTIAAPLKADHFLNDHRPPTDPDDD